MQQLSKYLFLGGLGGAIYYSLEHLYRGYSHWSMFLLGGICFLFCGFQNEGRRGEVRFGKQVLISSVFIVTSEYTTGMIVNKLLGWNIWDYSNQPYNIFGQVCLTYAVMFSILAAVAILLDDYLKFWLYGKAKPEYRF